MRKLTSEPSSAASSAFSAKVLASSITAGFFPRDLVLEADTEAVVADFAAASLLFLAFEVVDEVAFLQIQRKTK